MHCARLDLDHAGQCRGSGGETRLRGCVGDLLGSCRDKGRSETCSHPLSQWLPGPDSNQRPSG
jgi:hypothetical protein